eukprot:UN10663
MQYQSVQGEIVEEEKSRQNLIYLNNWHYLYQLVLSSLYTQIQAFELPTIATYTNILTPILYSFTKYGDLLNQQQQSQILPSTMGLKSQTPIQQYITLYNTAIPMNNILLNGVLYNPTQQQQQNPSK